VQQVSPTHIHHGSTSRRNCIYVPHLAYHPTMGSFRKYAYLHREGEDKKGWRCFMVWRWVGGAWWWAKIRM
jgi:hypothetical protein